ncbi:VOC family protein [Nocardia wallacei]|uniref:VOC family protein n=1 Tax=Nocardia wallacei TaxID=480035 RepID=UPI002457CE50|nr:VOC family protein [Nocardia wallacei]
MTTRYQVVIDTPDPNELARFWAEALGYVVENHTPLLRRMVDTAELEADRVVRVADRLHWLDFAAICEPRAEVDPETGIARGDRIVFQRVPEPKTAKNRLHLDLEVGPDRRAAEVARLEQLGARRLYDGNLGGAWTTMADPHGNEFCVQ